jgi:hypothetical protein
MRMTAASVVLILILRAAVSAQNLAKPGPDSATVPMALDQGRVVIDVDLRLPDGSTERALGWVDNGNPDFYMNRRVANLLGVGINCDGQICSGRPVGPAIAPEILIGGMKIFLPTLREIRIPLGPAIAPGMSAEINIPSTVLSNYDVLVDFPHREFSIGLPGRLKFNGVKSKMVVNPGNGLVQIPSKIENKNYDLGLKLGSSVNSLSQELFEKLSGAHPDWPQMTGAVGPFNVGEAGDEPKWRLMRVGRIQYGPLFLTDVAVTALRARVPGEQADTFAAGLLSSEALMNYRVGLDYAHSTVYFDIGRTVRFPDFDVVGLILRPEVESGFTIVGIADFEDNPSVAGVQAGDRLVAVDDNPVADFTLGQIWSLLEGSPGQERRLTIARAGKQFVVVAKVQHFLGDAPLNHDTTRKSKKN